MSIAGERLYPAFDPFHDPEPELSPFRDEGEATRTGERFTWLEQPNGLHMLCSPGESIDAYLKRMKREHEQRV